MRNFNGKAMAMVRVLGGVAAIAAMTVGAGCVEQAEDDLDADGLLHDDDVLTFADIVIEDHEPDPGAEQDQSDLGDDAPDDLEVEVDPQLLLGDIQCALSNQTDWVNRYTCNLVGGSFCQYATGTANYQTDWFSGEDCQPYLSVRTQTTPYPSNYPLTVTYYAAWTEAMPNNKSDCERARLELAAYYYNDNGGGTYLAGKKTNKGVWNGSHCTIGLPTIQKTLTCAPNNKCQRAQTVSARAYLTSSFWFPTAKKVHAGIFRSN